MLPYASKLCQKKTKFCYYESRPINAILVLTQDKNVLSLARYCCERSVLSCLSLLSSITLLCVSQNYCSIYYELIHQCIQRRSKKFNWILYAYILVLDHRCFLILISTWLNQMLSYMVMIIYTSCDNWNILCIVVEWKICECI